MKLISIEDVTRGGVDKRFGHRPWGAVVLLVLVLACAAVPIGLAREGLAKLGDGLPWWGWVLAAPVVLVAVGLWLLVLGAAWTAVRACFRRSNWVMKVTFEGLYLKFRSYLNYHFPEEGPTVVHLPWREIAAAQKTVDRTPSTGHRGQSETQVGRYLDLHLEHTDTEALRQAVAQEAARKAPKTGRSSTRFHHNPVQVPEPGVVRVEWRGRGMLRALQRYVTIRPAQRTGQGCAAAGEDLDGQIIKLIEQGRRMPAIRTVRRQYDMSLTQATEFVDDLVQGRVDAAAGSPRCEQVVAEG